MPSDTIESPAHDLAWTKLALLQAGLAARLCRLSPR
jgi:hypothetical protein